MPADRNQPISFDPSVLAELACPACRSHLQLEGERLACVACGRRYPIVDGIPVLIAERAEMGNEKPVG